MNKPKICIIGNIGNPNELVSDGGRVKTRLYKSILEDNGFRVNFINLHHWKYKFVFIFLRIVFICSTYNIVINMAGPKGCRRIHPILAFLKQIFKFRLIFCPLGTGVFDDLLKKNSVTDVIDFLSGKTHLDIKDNKIRSNLKHTDLIFVQTNTLKKCYEDFYDLSNVYILNNFRNCSILKKTFKENNEFHIVYCSRVKENKGIFFLLDAFINYLIIKTCTSIFMGICS